MNILVLNPGSSSLKSAVYRMPDETKLDETASIDAVGVRVVHGGSRFEEPALVDDAVMRAIHDLADLAPLHNPKAAKVIEDARSKYAVPVVAVFDTAFHQTLPPIAATYAVPPELGVRRYGFHGISYSYVSKRLTALGAGSRVIVAHLGNGASICAIRDGKSVDTSMGFTPMEGLVMGSRAGDIDPGVILYLLRKGHDEPALDDLLNHKSGLLALSGKSGDVRELEKANADFALDVFAYRAAKYIAAYAAVLRGVDAVAFTAGIGEHSASMRARICSRLAFLGVSLDEALNTAKRSDERRIDASGVAVWVIPTNEEVEIARAAYALIRS